jgi:hypothetical protein
MDYDNAVEGAENVIDCEKCYRLKSCGDRYYCAFIGLNPCIRGEHTPVQEYKGAANPLLSPLGFAVSDLRSPKTLT